MVSQVVLTADSLQIDASTLGNLAVMITDPPYSEFVHSHATSQSAGGGTRLRDLGFESLSVKARRKVAEFAHGVSRWSVIYSDVESISWLAISAHAAGAQYVRTMPWVRWSMPNLTGTMPPQGFEALVVLHSAETLTASGKLRRKLKPKAKHWNGPGNLTHFSELALRGDDSVKYSAEKPLDQALRLVSWFSDWGETVFDPFAGVGTIGVACKLLGRGYVGVEILPEIAERARARLATTTRGLLSDRDAERVKRWLDSDDEPIAKAKEGPSLARAEQRANDKARVLEALGAA